MHFLFWRFSRTKELFDLLKLSILQLIRKSYFGKRWHHKEGNCWQALRDQFSDSFCIIFRRQKRNISSTSRREVKWRNCGVASSGAFFCSIYFLFHQLKRWPFIQVLSRTWKIWIKRKYFKILKLFIDHKSKVEKIILYRRVHEDPNCAQHLF